MPRNCPTPLSRPWTPRARCSGRPRPGERSRSGRGLSRGCARLGWTGEQRAEERHGSERRSAGRFRRPARGGGHPAGVPARAVRTPRG
ncbi:hypothetical protein ACFFX0_27540 [Citricoccus parietis]|uniref:Uncharacterized protein n=1 Tax=Citricoccus parietis TaxID=592307 RepID=A0ABV5G765_9MICC